MITIIEDDILNFKKGTLIHSVNHKFVMGAGLARELRIRYPSIMTDYVEKCEAFTFQQIRDCGIISQTFVSNSLRIVSIFGQENYARDKRYIDRRYTDYYALTKGLESVKIMLLEDDNDSEHIAIPHGMACGLGGGNWEFVQDLIKDVFSDTPQFDIFIYKKTLTK